MTANETVSGHGPRSMLRTFGLVQRPQRGTVVRALFAAIVVAAIFWYFGATIWYALLFGNALTTLGLVLNSPRDTFRARRDRVARRRSTRIVGRPQ